jgi:hypothetical protein
MASGSTSVLLGDPQILTDAAPTGSRRTENHGTISLADGSFQYTDQKTA